MTRNTLIPILALILALFGAQANAEDKPDNGEKAYSCRYYTVTLPADWRAVTPPEENKGNVNAVFADTAGTTVTLIMGPLLGADVKMAADLFSEQFKGDAPTKRKDGSYVFDFKQRDSVARAIISAENDAFKLVAIRGNRIAAEKFLKDAFAPPEIEEKASPENSPSDKDKASAAESKKTAKTGEASDKNAGKEEKSGGKEEKETVKEEKNGDKGGKEDKNADKSKTPPAKENKKEAEKPGKAESYASKYYEVTLPMGWKAITPPEERQGNVNAIFADASGSAAITLVVGPSLGADAKEIAEMFAEQFKAVKAPVDKGGQWNFEFQQNGAQARAMVRVASDAFLLATAVGSTRQIDDFFANNIKSEEYADLLPR